MSTKDHYRLAKELSEKFGNFQNKYKKALFIAGCVMPDINFFTYIKGHTFKKRLNFITQNLTGLENKLKSYFSFYRMGILIHYIGDCFTFTHNDSFSGTLSKHIEYENRLHSYINNDFRRFENSISDIPKSMLPSALFEKLHRQYIKNKSSHENDCSYIYTACSETIKYLLYYK